eukprot:TRINITY_DN2197_c0_g1_i1.p1 TRINITY_DN2197_c0_g1~~TRINITY_DN2197_c0_g1_i1.p1  ORF type:complete len:292 (-),score=46.23 TRINITY_DN2197_c0_g1_i1:17-892(-)
MWRPNGRVWGVGINSRNHTGWAAPAVGRQVAATGPFVHSKCTSQTASTVWSRSWACFGMPLQRAHYARTLDYHGTTVLCVRKENQVVMISDGQVTLGDTVVKPNARKVRRIRPNILAGFAGTTSDAFSLIELLDAKLEEHQGQLLRACVSMAKSWRTDKFLRKLEAVLVVADNTHMLTVTGNGDVVEPVDNVIAIGSGGNFALAAAKALLKHSTLTAEELARASMHIAADMCIYTNNSFSVETLSMPLAADAIANTNNTNNDASAPPATATATASTSAALPNPPTLTPEEK